MNVRQKAYKEGETEASIWQIYQSETGKAETERTQGKKPTEGPLVIKGNQNLYATVLQRKGEGKKG